MDDVGLQVHDTLSLNSPASPVRHSRFAFLNTNLGVGSGASPLYVRGVTNVFDLEENKCNYLNFHFPSSRLATRDELQSWTPHHHHHTKTGTR